MVHRVVELERGTVVGARVVVVAGRAVVVVTPARVVVVAAARVVGVAAGVGLVTDVGVPAATAGDASPPPMWKVISTVLERTSTLARLGGMVSGAVPATT